MTISPGDILMADLNGVVVCPVDLLEKVIPLIQPQVEADEKMAEAIKDGMSFTEASKKFRRI
jgi:regulator of RNase E activity RraA